MSAGLLIHSAPRRQVRGLPQRQARETDEDAARRDHASSLRIRSYVSVKPSAT